MTLHDQIRMADAYILATVQAGDEARKLRERARPGSRRYDAAERKLHAAQDAHTEAWKERNRIADLITHTLGC